MLCHSACLSNLFVCRADWVCTIADNGVGLHVETSCQYAGSTVCYCFALLYVLLMVGSHVGCAISAELGFVMQLPVC